MDTLKLTQIVPDLDQPRKYFNAEKLRTLSASIKQQGVIQPLVVQKMADGKYLLIDGERRYRAATEAGLKEVPVIIQAESSAADRLIKQFEVQEQHEEWTLTEKAQALINLSRELKMSLLDTCKALHIQTRESSRYIAFSQLAAKDEFLRSELPLSFASSVATINRVLERIYLTEFKKDFTIEDKKRFEARFILAVKQGDITNRVDAVKLKDAFEKDPKTIKKFLENTTVTSTQLFLDAGAQGMHALRNTIYSARFFNNHARRYLEQPDVGISDESVVVLKTTLKVVQALLDSAKSRPTL